jgi:glycosyltransferase involved in cell wall biosynthesis
MKRICCWQPVLTPHQSHTLLAFTRAMNAEIRIVSSASEIAARKSQGWTAGARLELPVEVLPAQGWRNRVREILSEERDSIHIFGSPFERAKQNLALAIALWRRYEIYLISEPYSPVATGYLANGVAWKERLKAALRPKIYAIYGALMRNRLYGVFAISPAAVDQYRRMGVEESKIFPFGYFVPLPAAPEPRPASSGNLRIAYLGSFIRRKGVDVLLDAFMSSGVLSTGATLTLFGHRPDDFELPFDDRIRDGGPLPFGAVDRTLAEFDLLVVPSLYDGWAVVVNEAIGAGVPVLASSMVGAGASVERWECGMRFTSGDPSDLARCIVSLSNDRMALDRLRERTPLLAAQLQPDIAGDYMRECVEAARSHAVAPAAPWY